MIKENWGQLSRSYPLKISARLWKLLHRVTPTSKRLRKKWILTLMLRSLSIYLFVFAVIWQSFKLNVVVQYQTIVFTFKFIWHDANSDVYSFISSIPPTQNECTLWRLKVFVKEALKVQGKSPEAIGGKVQGKISEAIGGNKVAGSKRNREICDTLAKTAVRRTKKISNM